MKFWHENISRPHAGDQRWVRLPVQEQALMFSSPAESCPAGGLSHRTLAAQNQSRCLLHNRAIAEKSSSSHFCAKVGLAIIHQNG
jgi:hypothetical protein